MMVYVHVDSIVVVSEHFELESKLQNLSINTYTNERISPLSILATVYVQILFS